MMNELFGEFLGTLIPNSSRKWSCMLVLFFQKPRATAQVRIVITMGWGLQLRLQYLYLASSSPAHLNPTVTIGNGLKRGTALQTLFCL